MQLYDESGDFRCACPRCMLETHEADIKFTAQCLLDVRTAILEQNKVLEYLLVATAKKSSRDLSSRLNTIDLIRDLLGANDDAGDSPQMD